MAKLLCINAETYREGINNIGDILGVFEDNHPFTPRELVAFDIIEVKGMTREECRAKLPVIQTKEGFTDKATGDFIEGMEKPADKEITDLNRTTLWDDKGEWKVMAKIPKYQHTLASVDPKVIADFASEDSKVKEDALKVITISASLNVQNAEIKVDILTGKATSVKG